jgi:hypothetical protein
MRRWPSCARARVEGQQALDDAAHRPPWCSRPGWLFRVQMIASMRWRSRFGKIPGSCSSRRAGRTSVSSRPTRNSSKSAPAKPLPATIVVPGRGVLEAGRNRSR